MAGARPDWGGNAQDWGGNCPPLPHAGYGPESNIKKQKCFLKSAFSEGECVTLASFKIPMIIAKYQKPFSDGEFVKKCIFWKVGQRYILIIVIKIQL